MPAEGTIFYSWASARERAAFEFLVTALGIVLEEIGPPHSSTREPVRFWIDPDARSRIAELARYNGVADSTVFRLLFRLGLDRVESVLGGEAARRPVRLECEGATW